MPARCQLRKIVDSDLQQVHKILAQSSASENSLVEPGLRIEGARLFLESAKNPEAGIELFGIESGDELTGLIATEPSRYFEGEPETERLLCYWMKDRFAGQGFATRAVSLLIADYCVRTRITDLSATCFADNPASVRVLMKSGFRFVRQWKFERHPGLELHYNREVQLYRRMIELRSRSPID